MVDQLKAIEPLDILEVADFNAVDTKVSIIYRYFFDFSGKPPT